MDIPKKIGRYEILEELGHGAMGTVYRAKDPSMERVVAVKTIISLALASAQGSEYRERFYREARAAGGLAHPGIVPVFDVGEHQGLPYLVMEFINGQTLAAAVKRGERWPLDRVSEVGQQIAEALGYAHRHSVVHRDIKPANILMTSREFYGIERPKITDFGVAKMSAGQITTSGQMLGTPAFMPPEQFTGDAIDGRADLFSLGVILYWMATGEQAFPGETVTAVSYKVVHTDPVPPRKLNPSITARFDDAILRCLAKSPAERYQTGEELARDLAGLRTAVQGTASQTRTQQSFAAQAGPDVTLDVRAETLSALPTIVVPQAAIEVSSRRPRRNRLLTAAVVIVVLAVAALAGGRYALRNIVKATVKEMASSVAPAAAPASSPAARLVSASPQPTAPPSTPAPVERKAPPAANPELSPKAKTVPPARPSAVPSVPIAPALGFDPKALDPKANARLRIDAGHMPAGLDFTIEMNGKAYLRSSAEGNKTEYLNFFVPPGVQEFRVTARNGVLQKSSNTVSAEFKAKKKNTLTVELRTQGQSADAGVPQGLYPDSQIVLSLK